MTITKECELLAGDYLFLRDKLFGLQKDIESLQSGRPISIGRPTVEALSDGFILTWLGPPTSNIIYPNIPKTTLERVALRIRDALKEPSERIPLTINAAVAELQDEMWQKVVTCECKRK